MISAREARINNIVAQNKLDNHGQKSNPVEESEKIKQYWIARAMEAEELLKSILPVAQQFASGQCPKEDCESCKEIQKSAGLVWGCCNFDEWVNRTETFLG